MAGRQVSYTTRNFGAIVNKLDPKRLSEPQTVYVFDNGKTIKELPELPGEEYRWVRDIPDV